MEKTLSSNQSSSEEEVLLDMFADMFLDSYLEELKTSRAAIQNPSIVE